MMGMKGSQGYTHIWPSASTSASGDGVDANWSKSVGDQTESSPHVEGELCGIKDAHRRPEREHVRISWTSCVTSSKDRCVYGDVPGASDRQR